MTDEDLPLAFARNREEFYHLTKYLEQQGWCELQSTSTDETLTLTPAGFDELEATGRSTLDSNRAFVAMWFDAQLDAAYNDGIAPGIQAAGFRPTRIDLEQHNQDINDQIKAEIRRSRFLVADCTSHRNGVYFEAGFAMGLGLDVIWLCRKDEMGKAHFDTRNFNHLVWETAEDIRERLTNRIVSTIGIGPLKSEQEHG